MFIAYNIKNNKFGEYMSVSLLQSYMQKNINNFENGEFGSYISKNEAEDFAEMVQNELSAEDKERIDYNNDGEISMLETVIALEVDGLGINEEGEVCLTCGAVGDHFH